MNAQSPNPYYDVKPAEVKKNGFAIAALVLGLISLFGFWCCFISAIAAPFALVFGILALVKHQHTGMALTGLLTSVLTCVIVVVLIAVNWIWIAHADTVVPDFERLSASFEETMEQYGETREIPDYLQKYNEGEFEAYFEARDMDFYMVMDALYSFYSGEELSSESAPDGQTEEVDAATAAD